MSTTLVVVLLGVLAVSFLAAIALLVLTRRRYTPYVRLDPDLIPEISEALPLLSGVTESTIYGGNEARVLQNGELFPAMLDDIAGAARTIHLETFVWTAGEVERRFVAALCERSAAGVKVRVLIDAIGGGRADREQLERLRRSGVNVVFYCKARLANWRRFNHRTHRKLLIVDGRVGYTFGHGIADQWLGHGEDPEHWRDTGIRLDGPVVHALQSVFAQNWMEETGSLLCGEGCFPEIGERGGTSAHVVSSASGDEVSSVGMLYEVAIAAGRREVLIQNPYFAPDRRMVDLFAAKVRQGVGIHLMVPGRNTDSPFVRRAGCHLYEPLLRAGVRLYEFEPTLLHQKIVVVDGTWSHVGSTNFDARSLALNEEVGVGVLDARIAAELRSAFQHDLARSRELTLQAWGRRSALARAFDRLAYLVHDQL